MINTVFLKYFYDAAKNNSILESSKINHVSSTAVSSAIKKIEDYYGLKLLEHKKKQFLLTQEGTKLFRELPELFEAIHSFEKNITKEERELKGILKLATTNSLAMSVLPSFIESYNHEYPKVQVQITLGSPGVIKHLAETGNVDIGLTIQRNKPIKLSAFEIHHGSFYSVKAPYCQNEKYIVTDGWPEVLELEKKYKQTFQKDLPIHMVSPNWEIVKQFVEKGICTGLLPSYLISNDLELVNTELKVMDYKILIVKKGSLSLMEQSFYTHLKNFMKNDF